MKQSADVWNNCLLLVIDVASGNPAAVVQVKQLCTAPLWLVAASFSNRGDTKMRADFSRESAHTLGHFQRRYSCYLCNALPFLHASVAWQRNIVNNISSGGHAYRHVDIARPGIDMG
eukprot:591752-Amphidinium_carterae.1